jgi:hypothetical protein
MYTWRRSFIPEAVGFAWAGAVTRWTLLWRGRQVQAENLFAPVGGGEQRGLIV